MTRPAGSDTLNTAILQTLTYSDHFNFPLTREEVFIRLITPTAVSRVQFDKAINALVKARLISSKGEYLYLLGRSSLVPLRTHAKILSLPLLKKAKMLSSQLGNFPGILAIYLTGSLAMSNTDGRSDIDFMIITKPGKLWTTRLMLTIYTSLTRLRRTPQSRNHAGKLCLNLYLTPNSYLLPPHKRSLYTAYELIQAVPLYDPLNTHVDLLSSNSWIYNFLPNAPKRTVPKRKSRLQDEKGSPAGEGTVLTLTLDFVEHLLYHLQRLYMLPKLTNEFVTLNSAFFHPNNPGKTVLKKLKSSSYN